MTNLFAGCDGFGVGAAEGAGSPEDLAGGLAAGTTLFLALLCPRRTSGGRQARDAGPWCVLLLASRCPSLTSTGRTRSEQEGLCVGSGGCAPRGSIAFGPHGF